MPGGCDQTAGCAVLCSAVADAYMQFFFALLRHGPCNMRGLTDPREPQPYPDPDMGEWGMEGILPGPVRSPGVGPFLLPYLTYLASFR